MPSGRRPSEEIDRMVMEVNRLIKTEKITAHAACKRLGLSQASYKYRTDEGYRKKQAQNLARHQAEKWRKEQELKALAQQFPPGHTNGHAQQEQPQPQPQPQRRAKALEATPSKFRISFNCTLADVGAALATLESMNATAVTYEVIHEIHAWGRNKPRQPAGMPAGIAGFLPPATRS